MNIDHRVKLLMADIAEAIGGDPEKALRQARLIVGKHLTKVSDTRLIHDQEVHDSNGQAISAASRMAVDKLNSELLGKGIHEVVHSKEFRKDVHSVTASIAVLSPDKEMPNIFE